jgi:hypothetical protein
MYVMKHIKHNNIDFSEMLTEMTWPQLRRAERNATEHCWYREVTASRAHLWVKNGGLHDTPLWVDDTGRIRRS